MINCSKAIKLLYRVENPEVAQLFRGNTDRLERELERMARRKFKFVVSMQRYSKFKEEHENAKFLLRAYPDLQIAYLEEESPRKGGDPAISLIDGHSEFISETGRCWHSALSFPVTYPWGWQIRQLVPSNHLLPRRVSTARRCQLG